MNKKQLNLIPWIYFLLGVLGLVLRLGLYAAAEDDRGLLVPGHPLAIALWVLTAAAAVGAAVLNRKLDANPAKGLPGALGNAILLAGIILTLLGVLETEGSVLKMVYYALGGAAVGGLGYQAGKLLAKKQPFFGSFAMVCMFFCIQLVIAYQGWSEHPQLQDYVFGLFALLSAVLFAYFRAAKMVELKGKNWTAAFGLMGLFFSLTAIVRGEFPWLYAAEAIWLLLEMGNR